MSGIQEQEVFGQIADARSRLLTASQAPGQAEGGDKTPEQRQAVMEANNSFGGTIGRLLSLTESYPQLRSSESFLKLQDELSSTENRIKVSRDDFNLATTEYNTLRNSFPTVLTAGLLGFKEEPFYKADEGAQDAPRIGDANSLRRTQPAAPANTAP
jgi:LemA protein